MPHTWKHRVVLPPMDRQNNPIDSAHAVSEYLWRQLPPPVLRSLERVPGDPLRALTIGVTLDAVNLAMQQVYDWADEHDVWIEFVELEDLIRAGHITKA